MASDERQVSEPLDDTERAILQARRIRGSVGQYPADVVDSLVRRNLLMWSSGPALERRHRTAMTTDHGCALLDAEERAKTEKPASSAIDDAYAYLFEKTSGEVTVRRSGAGGYVAMVPIVVEGDGRYVGEHGKTPSEAVIALARMV